MISGAGNGWGKSEFIVALFAAVMWPQLAPPCFAHPALMDWKGPKRARIYSKPAELEEIGSLQTAIVKLFPHGKYAVKKGRYSYPNSFKADTGWILDLFSYERDESEAAGPNIGLQAFNEPPPQPLFQEAVARARAGGLIIGGMTSLHDNPWIVDGLFSKADGKDIRVRYGNACENCKQHGKNGNLEHDQIVKILAQYDEDEREARFTGRPLTLSGRIFSGFDRSVHVAKEEIIPPASGVTHYMAVDPAIGKPLAVIWAYVDAAEVVHVYDEYPDGQFHGAKDSGLTVTDYAGIFKAREGGKEIGNRIIDRHFANARRTLGGLNLKQEFAEAGLHFFDSYNVAADLAEVETGIMKIKEYLRYDKSKPLDSLNRPKLVISPKCHNLIASLEKWIRNPDTGKPKEDYKDHSDTLRYLLMSNPEYEAPRSDDMPTMPHYGVGNV